MRPTKYERLIKRAVVQSYGVASWLRSWMGGPVWALLLPYWQTHFLDEI
jgi:hypothetical protein